MSHYSDTYDQAHKVYRDARFDSLEANQLVGSAAVEIAEQVLSTGDADKVAFAVYKKAKALAEQKKEAMQEAWKVYDRAYQIMTGQAKEKPPAGATAEGKETKFKR